MRILSLVLTLLWLAPGLARAHAANTSYLNITAAKPSGELSLLWDLNAADLDWTVDLDPDANGVVTWSEVQARREAIAALAMQSLRVERGGRACALASRDLALTRHTDTTFVSLGLSARCPAAGALTIGSSLFFSQDASQRVLMHVTAGSQVFNTVLSPQARRWVQPEKDSPFDTVLRFVQQGIVHVWSGYDHIAFVLLLILPSVSRKRPARDLLTVITAFTLAHSVTLSLAVLRVVELPERWVEIAIVASIVAAALLNLRPAAARGRLAVAFGFGLMHGFGFAQALLEIDVRGARLLPMLAGFNLGVEIAQLLIVLIALPLLIRIKAAFIATERLQRV